MSRYFSTRSWREYGPLPTSDPPSPSTSKVSEIRHYNITNAILPSFRLPRRYTRLVVGVLVALGVLCFLDINWLSSSPKLHQHAQEENEADVPYPQLQETPPESESDDRNLPPLYDAYREYEDQLSEQRVANRTASDRYIFFANHAHSCGWGNVLQEMLFDALLADRANIGYVWDDYTWDTSGRKYSEFNGRIIASRTPFSTMLGGHILGRGPRNMTNPTKAPRAISSRVYHKLCPEHERVILEKDLLIAHLFATNSSVDVDEGPGTDVFDAWLSFLNTPKYKNARCIILKKDSARIFNIWLFGSQRIQSLWDMISHSVVLNNWDWSPLVHRAFEKNTRFFAADRDLRPNSPSLFSWFLSFITGSGSTSHSSNPSQSQNSNKNASGSTPPIPTHLSPKVLNASAPLPVLVLHLRRGDFEGHCQNLAEWSSTYTGFNSFPASRVRDGFDVPRIVAAEDDHGDDVDFEEGGDIGEGEPEDADDFDKRRYANDPLEVPSMDERKRVYAKHCFPDTRQVVKRVREVVRDYAAFAEERERERARSRKGGFWSGWWGRGGGEVEVDNVGDVKRSLQTRAGPHQLQHRRQAQKLAVGNESLKKIYIMTNGDPSWLTEVKKALLEDAEADRLDTVNDEFEWAWEGVSTSRDLDLGWEEKPVAQALDMYVAQRAEVFVGNGFSSLTSNIVMLRMKMGFDAVQTRFW
ncbi:hypothetical protein GALMADRAFT_273062 [Galerina marginata CBS 339.88]|uniref:Uncharacterized protein n=1 Tax=Galerina marginata (strain CBS 339.88) TaxID=685588 RepID=A0A067SA37_GALM3|nr:hypothetical protein GALMADRAFT_273062 [Galerina marginata CBS 339.88]